jgi:hypothetical protein
MSYSTSLKVYSGNSGALVTMTIAADEGFTGPVTISMNNILFTTPLGEEVAFADETCTVTLPATVNRGDVNNDDRINISDVTALIDFLLSDDDSHINRANSDVNQDGKINISDVTALIDYLLSGHF